MSFWKSRADIQDRYRRELFAGTVVACNADGTYDVALPGAAEPVRGVANAGELRFQAGNRVVVTRAGGRDGWQIHAGMAAGAPTRALNPDALIDAPPLVYWGGLTRSGAEAETIADYVDGRRWPLAALLRSGAEDGQMPLWSDAAGAWVPSSAGGQNVGALRALAAAGLAGCIAGAQRPWLVPPCVGGWLMIIGMETDPGLSAGAFVYSATSFGHVRAGAYPVQAMTLAYWKLDEAASSQNALDCSGHLRDLTPYEMSSSVSGAFYGARQWNGVTSYLHRAALPLQGSNQLSIELWIKPDSLANSPLLFYQEGSGSLQFEGGGTALRLYVITGGGTAVAQATTDPAVLCDGSWHYLAGVYDGATLRLYVDGQQTGTTPTHSGNVGAPASTNCYLGVHAPGWTYWSR
ncbi:MAG TPA: LamG domain-containing protein, partial [Armatimonadota bacterium]|nr:LamG domain-containing protein [Armatimonadota bacterium]